MIEKYGILQEHLENDMMNYFRRLEEVQERWEKRKALVNKTTLFQGFF